MKTDSSTSTPNLTRRTFIKQTAGISLVIGATGLVPQLFSCTDTAAINKALISESIGAWVRLTSDGIITILNPAAEMGQGSMTSLPVIFAEEMDADWDDVRVEFSPQESDIYGSEGWGPNRRIMLSAGSRVTKGYFNLLRRAGAQVRYVLRYSAAELWEVPLKEVTSAPSKIIHNSSGRSISYGDLVSHIFMPAELPDFKEGGLKDPVDFRLIGKDQPRTDIAGKVNGQAQFAIDVRLPGMLYAVIERGRVHGAKPTLTNKTDVEAMAGIISIAELGHGIGFIAEKIEQALAARKASQIEWSEAEMSGFDSERAYEEYSAIMNKGPRGRAVTEEGNARRVIRGASKIYKGDFKNDYVCHAQMEPLNSVVQVTEDGQHAEVWVGTQQGFDSKLGVPAALGIAPENVKIHMQYLGGGFGRRSMTDFVTEGALLAKEVAPRPVKLMWTREDDLTYGAYRPMSLQRVEAAVNGQGQITAFSHILVGDGDNLIASGIRNEYYDIPNQYAELRIVPHGVRLKHWRAVGHGPNKFAIECLIDEVARGEGIDPAVLRRRLMNKSPRALATLEEVVRISGWNDPSQEGRAKGMAFLERSGTLSSGVCEISVDRNSGKIKVHRFWSAHDAGIVIQPDNVRAQVEGGIVMGMSSVLKEKLDIVDGRAVQSNYHDYQLLRMEDAPESIETSIIASDGPPQGVGESGTPLVACCIANAFLALTGKRLRHLPFTPERVLEALNG